MAGQFLMKQTKYPDRICYFMCGGFVASLIPKRIINLNCGENNDTKYIYDKLLKSVG